MKHLQRLRQTPHFRNLTAETQFNIHHLIQPLFVVEDLKNDEDIACLQGVKRHNTDSLLLQIEKDLQTGVTQFLLFCVPAQKGLSGFHHDFATKAIELIKKNFSKDLCLWVDSCLCSMTSHGHCCLFHPDGKLDHSSTMEELSHAALSYVQAGADGISPSDMIDGRTAAIRRKLDENGCTLHPIMSYSTKFASQFYGPFRALAESTPQFGDRTQYQIDVRNRQDALASSQRCAEEGADLLMVKPGMTSLDLIDPIGKATGLKVGAYQVSGEYASLCLLSQNQLLNFERGLLETWHVFRRAGAQYIITYGARFARELGL